MSEARSSPASEATSSPASEAAPSPVEVRRLWPADKEAFRDHLMSLDPRSRHLRFGGGMSDEFLIHYAQTCFGKGDFLYGAFVDGKLIGAAELRAKQTAWSDEAPSGRDIHAEAAFSVDRGFRRRGVGEILFRRILRAAMNHGVETIEIVCLPENVGMQALARKFDAHFAFDANWLTGRLTVRRPTALSLIREASGDALDLGASLFDAHWRAAAEARAKRA